MPNNYTSKVAPIVKEIYSSGTNGFATTIANYFDIEWRQLTTKNDKYIDNGNAFSIGMYRQVDSLILDDAIKPIEGLIVDAKLGGVGFRNHTIPVGLENGAFWNEDILFIEPQTVCVDTNLTFDFTITTNISVSSSSGIKDLVLTDRGGFVNLNRTYPYYNRENPQVVPDLFGRAYKAAFLNNAYTMMYLNITNPNNSTYGKKSFSYLNSTLGKTFPMPASIASSYTYMGLSARYGYYLFGSTSSTSGDPKYPNPFNVTQTDMFSSIGEALCTNSLIAHTENAPRSHMLRRWQRGHSEYHEHLRRLRSPTRCA
jgi:hypothetical protein